MISYLTRRLIQFFLFIFLSSFIIYTAVVYMPYGPAYQYASDMHYDPPSPTNVNEVPQTLVDYYRVDKPWPLSYVAWLFDPTKTTEMNQNRDIVPIGIDISIGEWRLRGSGALTGDFGRTSDLHITSINGRVKRGPLVAEEIGKSWGNSAMIVGLAVFFAVLVAIPIGIIASAKPDGLFDRAVTFFSSLALSLPLYGLTYLLISVLAVLPYYLNSQQGWSWLPHLPAGSTHTSGQEDSTIDYLYHALLPALTLAIPQIAIVSKYVRSSMLEVLGLDYIRTAWAKGVPKWRILGKHAFRNALLPIITVIGLVLPGIASGAIVVEYAFAYQGLGYFTFRALGGCVPTADNPCSNGTGSAIDGAPLITLLVLLVGIIALANLVADFAYMAADPRVEYSRQGSRQ